ncbi:slipin family protein [Vaginella massiliensis]|uniref:slipin family protein n=1 Tax=Vaginella massiliensis TaxID=1816680 RepID=UPI000A8112AB|nr:slipin family protein [Vaginella massiliensis]
MAIFKKKYQVKPNTVGFLYRDNVFEQKLNSGIHEIWDPKNRTELFTLPETSKLLTITNQEVLTKDNIALRFSFYILYTITDGQTFLSKFALDRPINEIIQEAEQRIYTIVQRYIRNKIAELDSETLNEKRNELTDFKTAEMEKEVSEFGITIEQAQLRDLTFPRAIQDLFAKHLEAKIRAKSELENARTAVATARALKNASELMKDDENIKFFQIIETITKIADKGKHTFMIGDINQLTNK